MGEKSVRVVIEGRVQGVWYRGWTIENAKRLDLIGWVRNKKNGSVEALFSGESAKVDEMINACWNGPISAEVSFVVFETDKSPETKSFLQLPTI